MTEVAIRLDRSKPFAECRGERASDDPHYKVHYWQGQRVKGEMVLLPFDARGELVPDDGRKDPYPGVAESKPVMHQPLYTEAMRALLESKRKKSAAIVKDADAEKDEDEGATESAAADEEVNFTSWLKGEARYQPHLLRSAARKRYSKTYTNLGELVVDLVLDEKLVPEDQVCEALAKHLPAKAAA